MDEEMYINVDGIGLHAKLDKPAGHTSGKMPLVILVHGLTGNMEEKHIIAAKETMNACGYAVLRVETHGHGQSDGSFENHTILKWIDNILGIIDYAKNLDFVSDVLVAGHSQGGLLAMLAAGLRPDALKGVIALSPALMLPDLARSGNFMGVSFDPDHIPDRVAIGPYLLKGDYFSTMQMIHPDEAIRKYHNPVLIVQGSGDEYVPLQYSERAAALYDDCTFDVIPGANHGYDGHLDQMQAAFEKFLNRLLPQQNSLLS